MQESDPLTSRPMTTKPRFPLVVVTGVGHSGTTLLGTLLNAHQDVHCVGEMARIGSAIEHGKLCSCGARNDQCAFWKPILPILKGNRSFNWEDMTPEMYERVRLHVGSKVLVDVSKTLSWRMQRPSGSPWKTASVGYIWLVRDSRGVMASRFRAGQPVVSILARHRKWIERIEKFMRGLGERGITLFYEDLCADPRREMERICRWMTVPFDKGMLRPAGHAHHFTHANGMTYLGRGNEIRKDERWRSELPADLREEIEDSMRRVPFLRDRYLLKGSDLAGESRVNTLPEQDSSSSS